MEAGSKPGETRASENSTETSSKWVFVFCSDSFTFEVCMCLNDPHYTIFHKIMLYVLLYMYMYISQTTFHLLAQRTTHHPLDRAQRQERESLHSMKEVTEVSYCHKFHCPTASVCEMEMF